MYFFLPPLLNMNLAIQKAIARITYEKSLQLPSYAPHCRLDAAVEQDLIDHIRQRILPLPPPPPSTEVKDWTKTTNTLFELLLLYGFHEEDVRRAMMATHGAPDLLAMLTWLCIHTTTDRIPPDMRDNMEYTMERPSPPPPRQDTPPPKMDTLTVAARIDQQPPPSDVMLELDLVTAINLDPDIYDDDPSYAHSQHVLKLREYEEWHDLLLHHNQHNRYSQYLDHLNQCAAEEKRALDRLEQDLLFIEQESLDQCLLEWPALYDQLLDDMATFKDSQVDVPSKVEEAEVDLDLDLDLDLGLLDLEDSEDTQPVITKPTAALLDTTEPKGWVGRSTKTLVIEYVHRYDTQAEIRYDTTKHNASGGFLSTMAISWSTEKIASTQYNQLVEAEAVELIANQFHIRMREDSLVVGRTKRDAENIASLICLFAQQDAPALMTNMLVPSLRDMWEEWIQATELSKRQREEEEAARRMEFLDKLYLRYQEASTTAIQDSFDQKIETETPLVAASGQRAKDSMRLRQQKWNHQTIGHRRSAKEWRRKFNTTQPSLPARQHRNHIDDALNSPECRVFIVRGETGSGKSSQVPQFVLEQMLQNNYQGGRIICTQPRRISATSIASRVSDELGDSKGAVGGKQSLVGHQIRYDSRTSDANALVFVTTGVLLRMLTDDPQLPGVDCVICDEVQERTLELDYLLVLLRRLLKRKSSLRVILMSATIDTSIFTCYFDGCQVVEIPGRTFPVECMYLEDIGRASCLPLLPKNMYPGKVDVNLISQLLRGLCATVTDDQSSWTEYCREHAPDGAILVFLPGLYEIRALMDLVHGSPDIMNLAAVVPLHSALMSETAGSQSGTFAEIAFAPAPPNRRKIVLSTNIAETGITIPDVTVVIDCGLSNQTMWDKERRLTRLSTQPISQANVRQRRGRAGRVQPGLALCLFTQQQYQAMSAFEMPEIQRSSLNRLCLMAKSHGAQDILQFVQQTIEPPSQAATLHAIKELQRTGALDEQERLTPMGRHLCYLPVGLAAGKLLIMGALLRCLDPVLTIAAIMSVNLKIFQSPIDKLAKMSAKLQHAKYYKGGDRTWSDFAPQLAAYQEWRNKHATEDKKNLTEFCKSMYLNAEALSAIEDCREQFLRQLHELGLVKVDNIRDIRPKLNRLTVVPKEFNICGDDDAVVSTAIVAAFDHILMHRGDGYKIGQTAIYKRVEGIGRAIEVVDREKITMRSVALDYRSSLRPSHTMLVAAELAMPKTITQQMVARSTTCVPLVAIVLFARTVEYWPKARLLIANGWIETECCARTAVVLLVVRRQLSRLLDVQRESLEEGEDLANWQSAIIQMLKELYLK